MHNGSHRKWKGTERIFDEIKIENFPSLMNKILIYTFKKLNELQVG
jgi:hypothetical protein